MTELTSKFPTATDGINFEQDKQDSLTKVNDAKSLSEQVVKLQELNERLEDLEDLMKKTKKDIEVMSGEVSPPMMQERNLSTLKISDGSSVEVKPIYGASISPAKKEEAFNWLRSNGLGDLIKNEITVSFGRNEDNKAAEYAVLAQGQGYQPVQKLKVEPMTLKALVRERLEAGQEMPTELFNVFAGNRTKITRSK